jgi:hypothetical protein
MQKEELLKIVGHDLTAEKTARILEDGYEITGFVLKNEKYKTVCIVSRSAVRWLDDDEMYWLMQNSDSPIFKK